MAVLRNLQKKSKKIPKISVLNTTTSVENHVYYFGSFCLDEAERQLIRNGKPLRLAPKLFDVLLVLIQNKGSLVRKERLLREVWPDVFVEEANLSVNIASLRKALDGGRSEEQWIETVPKQGYRFMAPVFEPPSDDAIEESDFGTGDNTGNEIINTVAVLPFENEGCGAVGEYLSDG